MYEERANLRAAIDASPLWDVDVATRKALFQPMLKKLNGREEPAGDDPAEAAAVDPKLEETYKRVWAECFELFPTEDATILSMAFPGCGGIPAGPDTGEGQLLCLHAGGHAAPEGRRCPERGAEPGHYGR